MQTTFLTRSLSALLRETCIQHTICFDIDFCGTPFTSLASWTGVLDFIGVGFYELCIDCFIRFVTLHNSTPRLKAKNSQGRATSLETE